MKTVWDDQVKGLHLRTRDTGHQAYYFFYRTKSGIQRRPKIGNYPEITVQEARKRAKGIADLVAQGIDPKGDWDLLKEELTVEKLFIKTWNGYWNKERFNESRWSTEVMKLWKNHLSPTFGRLKLSEVTPIRVRKWHAEYEHGARTTANRALSILSRMFSYAEEEEFRTQNTNPCRLVTKFRERKRKRYATEQEIRLIHEVLQREASSNPRAVAFIYILMFSGSRPRAIERATHEQLIRHNGYGILTFKGKTSHETGDDEQVILPPPAMKILDQLEPSKDGTLLGIKMPRDFWMKIKKEVGCKDLWARDWRRTFATIGLSNGIEVGMIGELLNHKSAQTTKVYAKLIENEKLNVSFRIAQMIQALASTSKELQAQVQNEQDQKTSDPLSLCLHPNHRPNES